ncbi:SAF domain-containing protein [Alicyclobacillus tolerans]|uniref:SAF domain-containing protein n=1 Tax=Alicyclobacillus tolerans TaxID=90970 RepID=UPI001F3DC591|nr:SAF domain-containing protein [Alicyclobacillus tolerans]MCF8563996.1 SAF domain-containing protein [Alicyclobacillus tolerans]
MKTSKLMFSLSVLVSLGAGLLATTVFLQASQTQTVVMSTHNLQPYTQIGPSDIKLVTVPKSSGIKGLATSEADVIGRYLSFAVPSGYPITKGDLNASSSYSAFLTQYVEKTGKPGMLLSIPVQSALSQVVNAGEDIALIVPSQVGGQTSFQTIEPVPVLSVLQPAKGGTATALLVFVTEQNYNVLAPAILNNNVQIGLIPQNGSFSAPESIQLQSNPSASQGIQPAQNSNANESIVRTQGTSRKNQLPSNSASNGGAHG